MKQEISMYIDMTDDPKNCMLATLHKTDTPYINIHSAFLPVTIRLTPDQAFDLFVNLKSTLKNVQLALKERG